MAVFAVKEKNKRILALEKERKLLLEKHRTLQATASALASAVRAKDEELQSTQRFSRASSPTSARQKEALQTRVDALSAPQQPQPLVDLLGDVAPPPSLPPPQQHQQRAQRSRRARPRCVDARGVAASARGSRRRPRRRLERRVAADARRRRRRCGGEERSRPKSSSSAAPRRRRRAAVAGAATAHAAANVAADAVAVVRR